MAWNTITTATAASPWGATQANGVGLDLRTWGGNIDAAGYNLSNLGQATVGNGSGVAGIYLNASGAAANNAFIFGQANGANEWLIASARAWVGAGARGLYIGTTGADPFAVYTNAAARITVSAAGIVKHHNTPVYADNAAAVAGGLTAGMQYRTSTGDLREVY